MIQPPLQSSVRDLLRVRHSHVVSESATLRDVAERFIVSDCDVMAVVDGDVRLVGVICETDVIRALLARQSDDTTIQSIITRHAESVRVDATLTTVLPLFRSEAYTALPVVDAHGYVCGLLMRRDVLGEVLNRASGRVDESLVSIGSAPARVVRDATLVSGQRTGAEALRELSTGASHVAGPHFLRADAARRILWAAEDRL